MRIRGAAAILASFLFAVIVAGEEAPLRVLFVGNSLTYANDLPAMVRRIGDATGRPIHTTMIAAPDHSLGDHLAKPELARALAAAHWDFVVLQQGPSSRDDSRALLIQDSKAIATLVAGRGTRIALLMVWPPSADRAVWSRVAESYRLAAEAAGGTLIPAGHALAVAMDRDTSVPLLASDHFHPTPEGTYLMALVVYRSLVGRVPKEITEQRVVQRVTGVRLRLPPATLRMLVQTANETAR